MGKIKTTWEYSTETEALRVLHCAHKIATGFYRVNNFYVLPKNNTQYSTRVVVFPDLPYHRIPRFWDKARHIDVNTLPIKADKKVVEQVKRFLEKEKHSTPDYSSLKKTWDKAESEIITKINQLVPSFTKQINEIVIYPTVLGTSCSFNLLTKDEDKIYIYLREDQDIYSITEAIVTSLTRAEIFNDLTATWSESELLTDWLITKSSLSKTIAKYQKESTFTPTLKGTRAKQNAKLLKMSDDYYRKLGLSTSNKIFSINGKVPEAYKKPLENLTTTEINILRLFIENSDKIVTFDEIATSLFIDTNNFSLYAITKTIQRLRDKLEANGISGSYIQTLRGQGYLLKN